MTVQAIRLYQLLVCVVTLLALAVGHAGAAEPSKKPVGPKTEVFDSLGELFRSMQAIDKVKPTLPDGDKNADTARNSHKIPDRVSVSSPHGGTEIAVMVYQHEDMVPLGGKQMVIGANQYRHLVSQNNLRGTYLLFESEPLRIGDQVYAFKRAGSGIAVYFVNGTGSVEEVMLAPGQSLYVTGGKFIIKGVANR